MAQQTAVDYLISELRSSVLHKNDIRLIRPYINHALKMEKEQIIQAYVEGINLVPCNVNSTDELDAEQYYNETYGNESV